MNIQIQDRAAYTVMDWKKWLRQGDQYLKAAGQGGQKSRKKKICRIYCYFTNPEDGISSLLTYNNLIKTSYVNNF